MEKQINTQFLHKNIKIMNTTIKVKLQVQSEKTTSRM